jgi:hypothetical protein
MSRGDDIEHVREDVQRLQQEMQGVKHKERKFKRALLDQKQRIERLQTAHGPATLHGAPATPTPTSGRLAERPSPTAADAAAAAAATPGGRGGRGGRPSPPPPPPPPPPAIARASSPEHSSSHLTSPLATPRMAASPPRDGSAVRAPLRPWDEHEYANLRRYCKLQTSGGLELVVARRWGQRNSSGLEVMLSGNGTGLEKMSRTLWLGYLPGELADETALRDWLTQRLVSRSDGLSLECAREKRQCDLLEMCQAADERFHRGTFRAFPAAPPEVDEGGARILDILAPGCGGFEQATDLTGMGSKGLRRLALEAGVSPQRWVTQGGHGEEAGVQKKHTRVSDASRFLGSVLNVSASSQRLNEFIPNDPETGVNNDPLVIMLLLESRLHNRCLQLANAAASAGTLSELESIRHSCVKPQDFRQGGFLSMCRAYIELIVQYEFEERAGSQRKALLDGQHRRLGGESVASAIENVRVFLHSEEDQHEEDIGAPVDDLSNFTRHFAASMRSLKERARQDQRQLHWAWVRFRDWNHGAGAGGQDGARAALVPGYHLAAQVNSLWKLNPQRFGSVSVEVEPQTCEHIFRRVLLSLPRHVKALVVKNVPLGSAGMETLAQFLPRCRELKRLDLANCHVIGQCIEFDDNQAELQTTISGTKNLKGLRKLLQALSDHDMVHCTSKSPFTLKIKGFVGFDATRRLIVGSFTPTDPHYLEQLAARNQSGVLRLALDLTDSLNAQTMRLLTEACHLQSLVVTGNSYEGDGVHYIAKLLDSEAGEGLTEVAVDAGEDTDVEVLELLLALVKHQRMKRCVIVWSDVDSKHAIETGQMSLSRALLKINPTNVSRREYFLEHSAVSLASAHRRDLDAQIARHNMETNGQPRRHCCCLREKQTQKHYGRHIPRATKVLVLDEAILAYPISLALRISVICREFLAKTDSQSSTATNLEEMAEAFEELASNIFSECYSLEEAEVCLREHKDARVLRHFDMFQYCVRQKDPPRALVANKWFRSYVDKLWQFPDLSIQVHDHYYAEFMDVGVQTRSSIFNAIIVMLLFLIESILIYPLAVFTNTHEPPGPHAKIGHLWGVDHHTLTRNVARLNLFWSVPTIKYHCFVGLYLSYLANLVRVAVDRDIGLGVDASLHSWAWTWSDYYIYVFAISYSYSEVQQLYRHLHLSGILQSPNYRKYSTRYWKKIASEISYHYNDRWNMIDLFIGLCSVAMFICKVVIVDALVDNPTFVLTEPGDGRFFSMSYPILYRLLLTFIVIMAFLRSFVILLPIRRYGKLILMVFRMIYDIGNFLVIYCLVAMTFAVAFMALYQQDADHFWSLSDALEYVVYASFGEFGVATRWSDVSMGELMSSSSTTVQFCGKTLFVVLQMFLVVLLVNLLVAMMSNTYDSIEVENEREWLVAQSGLLDDFALKIRSLGDLPLFNVPSLAWRLLKIGKVKTFIQSLCVKPAKVHASDLNTQARTRHARQTISQRTIPRFTVSKDQLNAQVRSAIHLCEHWAACLFVHVVTCHPLTR